MLKSADWSLEKGKDAHQSDKHQSTTLEPNLVILHFRHRVIRDDLQGDVDTLPSGESDPLSLGDGFSLCHLEIKSSSADVKSKKVR